MLTKLIISILLLQSLFFLASSSSVESEATCVGIDFSSGAYVCTSNPVETRRAVHHVSPSYDDMDLGVVQRMSGSAGETWKNIYYDYLLSTLSLLKVADEYRLFDYHTTLLILSKKAEQLKIGEVLTKMRKYFENEVLVRSEYAHVRDRW